MFKKLLIAASAFLLVACEEVESPSQEPPSSPAPATKQETTFLRTADQGKAMYRSIIPRVAPVAKSICQDFSKDLPARFCDFQYTVVDNPNQPPNAFQTVNRAGQPVIAFNINMLRTMKNQHETAFILGHEAAHQIARHLLQRQQNVTGGAILGSIIAGATGIDPSVGADLGGAVGSRAYSKTFELQADAIGTHIAARAGFNPSIGAQSFTRFGGSNALLSTHPPAPDRIATVEREWARYRAGDRRIPCYHSGS